MRWFICGCGVKNEVSEVIVLTVLQQVLLLLVLLVDVLAVSWLKMMG